MSIRFMADGGYQRAIGQDHALCMAQSTVSKYLAQFCRAMLRIMVQWIKFPGDAASRAQISQGFQNRFGIPNILGTIDCTHVEIFPPPQPHGVQYINRKRKHTINVQLVSDVNCRTLRVQARFPGSVHDQFIFNHSIIKNEMRRIHEERIGEYFLLGDSGYALEPWMMTPIGNVHELLDQPEIEENLEEEMDNPPLMPVQQGQLFRLAQEKRANLIIT